MTSKVLTLDRNDMQRAISVQSVPYEATLKGRDYRRIYYTELAQAKAAFETERRFVFKGRVYDSAVSPRSRLVPIVLDLQDYPTRLTVEEFEEFNSKSSSHYELALSNYHRRVTQINESYLELDGVENA